MNSASPHLSKPVKPADYLSMWCVDIVGLCFPNSKILGNPLQKPCVCVLGKCNTNAKQTGDTNEKFLSEVLSGVYFFIYLKLSHLCWRQIIR